MPKSSKRYNANYGQIDCDKRYEVAEAITLLKDMSKAKFDETVEVSIRLGVDPKKSDQMVRGVCKLPNGSGRKVRILVLAKGEKVDEAKQAGADFVGAEDMVDKIKEGWLDFDKVIATPDMMPKVGPIARILGPRGLMPNPKVGTVTTDVAKAVQEEKAGRVEFRVEKAGIVHAAIGKLSFDADKLQENFVALMDNIAKLKPAAAKGTYVKAISFSSTMGPGLRIDAVKAQSSK
jgi:large subunit ribosomal protein L1